MAALNRTFDGRRVALIAAGVGTAGTLAMIAGLLIDPVRARFSYLVALVYALSVAVGSLIFLMIGHAASVQWVAPLRRLNEMIAWGVCPLAVLFVPLCWGLDDVYLWVDPPSHLDPSMLQRLQEKQAYLNVPAFLARSATYLVVWVTGACVLRRWSLQRDDSPVGMAAAHRDRAFATGWLIPVSLAVTFAAFDWLMSLQPDWLSSIFGVYYFAGGFVSSFALLTMLSARARSGPLSDVIGSGHFHALGRMQFAFLLFWGYCAYFQLMLIREADKPSEVLFYTERLHGSWAVFPHIFLIGHFALPMAMLVARRVKSWPRYLAAISLWLLCMHFVEIYWLVLPLHSPRQALPHWLDASALCMVCGWTVSAVAHWHHGRSLLALGDPRLDEGIAYGSAT